MPSTATIACIGECMVEFRQTGEDAFAPGFGGDTLNTAVYLSRLGQTVDYVTALGDDPWSTRMKALWEAEGVGTGAVVTVAGAMPGLYVIETDERGERRFSYWRDNAPARRLFDLPETAALCERLTGYRLLYFSGISLSLYGPAGRARLFEALARARENGAQIAFDTNFRPRGWPDLEEARKAFTQAFAVSSTVFASTEDLDLLFEGETGPSVLAQAAEKAERVVKHSDLTVIITAGAREERVKGEQAARVVDTTAAGDSFAAAYLAARLEGAALGDAARAGHRLAGRVVGHPGALIPRDAMPS